MTEAEAVKNLEAGAAILKDFLEPHGFALGPIRSGAGSGGSFAWCEFNRGNRRLQLHFRQSLGLVEYQLGETRISHEDYMWSVRGERRATSYPGFSKEPLDEFRHLAADLAHYGQNFVRGDDQEFVRHAERAAALRNSAPRIPQ
jgi:hypothetical protein